MHETIVAIVLAAFASTGFWSFLTLYVEKKSKKKTHVEEAVLGLLHDRIYGLCKENIAAGKITTSEFENLKCLYDPYEKMGGNGTGKRLMQEVERLPITED